MIRIPEEILNKPGRLTDEEFKKKMNHTVRSQYGSFGFTLFWPDEVAVSGFQSVDQDILSGTEAVSYGHEVDPLGSFFYGHPPLQRSELHNLIPEGFILHNRTV